MQAAYAMCDALEGFIEVDDPGGHPAPTWWVKGYTQLTLKGEKLKVGHCTGKPTDTALACLKVISSRAQERVLAVRVRMNRPFCVTHESVVLLVVDVQTMRSRLTLNKHCRAV